MRQVSNNDTICAIATPPGPGGIGIVRISGPRAFDVLGRVWQRSGKSKELKPWRLYLGEAIEYIPNSLKSCSSIGCGNDARIVNRLRLSQNKIVPNDVTETGFVTVTAAWHMRQTIDRAMAVRMPAPNTYTGDDVVEISCHGSQVVLARLLDTCITAGARLAEPGEFTRRAFLAGKLDLIQAEAVCDLINATNERAARIASDQLDGRLSSKVRKIASELSDLRAIVEASIDFPEEGISEKEAPLHLQKIIAHTEQLAATYLQGRMISEGVRVAIVGKPNVGKSSILNYLVGHKRAIVHHTPGTTRDIVEEKISIYGVEFRLRDTAGMRDGAAEVEAMGIAFARNEIKLADIVLNVFDGSAPLDKEDKTVIELTTQKPAIFLINKKDLQQKIDIHNSEIYFKTMRGVGCPYGAGEGNRALRRGEGVSPSEVVPEGQSSPKQGFETKLVLISLSALTGEGFDELKKLLVNFVKNNSSGTQESSIVTSARHKTALDDALAALKKGSNSIEGREPIECVAQHLRIAQESLGTITGEVTNEDLLNKIFSRFCIGK